jgi:cupin 2 domain-containing protein
MDSKNIFQEIPASFQDELAERLAHSPDVRIERIVSQGHCSANDFWYDQDENEWVMVVQGHAKLEYRDTGKVVEMKTGDWVDIPAHCRHRVTWTDPDQPTIWLAVFYRPR